jgi:Amidases related to nicotinamidase
MTISFLKTFLNMKPTLLIVDVQNDYFPGGKMELFEMNAAAANIAILLAYFRKNQLPVIFIQHIATRPNATFFLPETQGAEIHDSIRPTDLEPVFVKHYPNSFRETRLDEYLHKENLRELVICGAMSHMCIDTTTRAAFDLGYSCTVIADACATRDLSYNNESVDATRVHLSFMAALNGTFANVISTEKYLEMI